MTDEQLKKMNLMMYFFTKEAAKYSFTEFLDDLGVTDEDYEAIKEEWKKIGITDTYL